MPTIGLERVKRLRDEHARGASITTLSRREKINVQTLRRALRGETYPDAAGTYWLTVGLPGELVARLRLVAGRRGSILDEVVQEALVAFLPPTPQ
jgi:hypothetical protein